MASRLGRPAGLFFRPLISFFFFLSPVPTGPVGSFSPRRTCPRSLFGDTATERRADRTVCHRRICLYSSCYFVTPYLPWRLRTTLRRPQTSVAGSSHENVADRPSYLLEPGVVVSGWPGRQTFCRGRYPRCRRREGAHPRRTRRRVGAATRLPSGGRLTRKGLFGSRFGIPRFRSRV